MPLPVLHHRPAPDPLRIFHHTEQRWLEHAAESCALDVGTAYTNPKLPSVFDSNNLRDAALPPGLSPEAAVAQVEAHYAARKTRCCYWVMNPSASADRTEPLVQHLLSRGCDSVDSDIMLLARAPVAPIASSPGLTIIPARASYRHFRLLAEESARRWQAPPLADAKMLHLDDPHYDVLLALKDGLPVASVGVLAVGEVGRIEPLYVAQAFRNQGLGQLMLSRILELCVRSQFRQVLLSVFPTNAPAIHIYQKAGFRRVGSFQSLFTAPFQPPMQAGSTRPPLPH